MDDLDLSTVLARAQASLDQDVKDKARCGDAADALYQGWKDQRRISVGVGRDRKGWVIHVYGETAGDLDALPSAYRGFTVVATVMGVVSAL